MCGICGFNFDDKKLLSQMLMSLKHRGPDDSGSYVDGKISSGQRRLSIIDLKTGKQPIYNEDKSLVIVLNGEIYNYKELKKELETKNHKFYTNTDTEVIIHAYEEYEENCVKHLRGIFAFVIWDSNKKTLFLARDRLGVKPLYFYFSNALFIFASEIKAILCYREIEREVDSTAFRQFMALRYSLAPRTMFKNIKKLLPGHYLIYSKNGLEIKGYWDLKENIANENIRYYSKNLRRLLEESVKMRLMSDVPLGAYLSGGLDSSTIVALMSKYSTEPINTFSVGFGEDVENELRYAKIVADTYGCSHTELTVDLNKCEKILDKIIWHLDEPIVDAAVVPTYLISELTKKKVTVVLAGEGGDELFAGYFRYKVMNYNNYVSKIIPKIIRAKLIYNLSNLFPEFSNVKRMLRFISMPNERMLYLEVAKLFERGDENLVEPYFGKSSYFLNKLLYTDIKTLLPEDFFMKIDKMTMAHGIEERVPVLDHKIVEFSMTIPTRYKLHNNTEKFVFRKAVHDLLPNVIRKRKKQGYNVPMDIWMRTQLKDRIRQMLDEKKCKRFFDYNYMQRLFDKLIKSGDNNYYIRFSNAQMLWGFMTFELWHEQFIENEK